MMTKKEKAKLEGCIAKNKFLELRVKSLEAYVKVFDKAFFNGFQGLPWKPFSKKQFIAAIAKIKKQEVRK
jgi:hypothetical protein